MKIDVLAIGAHPDDIEISCSGTIAKLVAQSYKVGILDLTQGELGTRGNKKLRMKESQNAAKVLKVSFRKNLNLQDGNIKVNQKNILKIIPIIRHYKPEILLIPHFHERHPDHEHTHYLAKESWFYSGLEKIKTKFNGNFQEPFRPQSYFQYMQRYEFQPTFIVDISDTYKIRQKSIGMFSSQFYSPNSNERETFLSSANFIYILETRAKYFGQKIGVQYGEPFYFHEAIGIKSIFDLNILQK